jgi:L-ascorbate metabolism protein UlaG (beta-lactamase superfamily)
MDLQGTELTWLGHAAVRFRLPDGQVVLVDPWLQDNPACPDAEQQPERVDAVFVTHGHFDHLGNTVDVARRLAPEIFCNAEIGWWLEGQGIEGATGLNTGGTVQTAGGLSGTLVPAVHSSGITADDGIANGGAAGGWVLRLPGGPTVYHAGDTFVFGDMALIAELFAPDIALLPIGGHFTMDPRAAAHAVRLLGVQAVVPIHYATFPLLAGTPDQLRDEVAGAAEVVELTPGDPVR